MAKQNRTGVLSRITSLLTPADPRSATDMLRADHRRVEALFQEFESADRRKKGSIAQKAVEELTVHAALEEEIFYPAVAAEMDEDRPVECAIEEHGLMKKLLEDLAGMKPGAPHFEAKFKVLQEIVRHHVGEEESGILPEAESSDLELEDLGAEMLERRQELLQGGPSKRTAAKRSGRKRAASRSRRGGGRATSTKSASPQKTRQRPRRRATSRGGRAKSGARGQGSRKKAGRR